MKRSVGLAALTLVGSTLAFSALAEPISSLTGFWSGTGSVILAGGNTERVKCQVFYKSSGDDTQLRQTLRCASADYTINATADLEVKGGQVKGSWEEKTYAVKGEVSGHYSGDNFSLTIKGVNFSAAMNMTLSACKQSINITPQGLDVTRVTIGLAKC